MGLVLESISFFILMVAKTFSHVFYRTETRWIEPEPKGIWDDVGVIAILNHTSLYEWLYAAIPPVRFMWRVAGKAVIPVADVTTSRPVVGWFFRLLARNTVSISREKDHTWEDVLRRIEPDRVVIILPEGRMKRPNGLDRKGNPMTVRRGIADIIKTIPEGKLLIAYSGGLHHVQVPGQTLPRLFRTLRMTVEVLDIGSYRESFPSKPGTAEFKKALVEDLERRRDLYCHYDWDEHPVPEKETTGLTSTSPE